MNCKILHECLEQPVAVSSAIDKLCRIQYFIEISEIDKIQRFANQHNWFLKDFARISALHFTFSLN